MALFPKRVENHVGVSAFGKHPAYADHLPDLGDTSALASRLRQTFYTGGILARAQDWESLQKSGSAIPFGHFVLYREIDAGAGGAALLRLWPSRDAVNRSDFPMILAAVASGVATDWLLSNAPAVLMEAEPKCKAAKSLESLSAAVQAAGEELQARSPAIGNGAEKRAAESVRQLLSDPGFGPQLPSLVAALRPLREFLPLDDNDKSPLPSKAATSRAAAWSSPPLEGLAKWSALLDTALAGRKTRYFLIAPDNGEWIDLIVGEPTHRQFMCLRAGPAAIAPAAPASSELFDELGGRIVNWLNTLAGGNLPLA